MGKVIYKNMEKSDALNDTITTLLEICSLDNAHVTVEKRNKVFYIKASKGRYVVCKRDFDAYGLAEKVIHTLHKQIRDYESKQLTVQRRNRADISNDSPIQKIKKFIIKPMEQEEALSHMNLLGHKFYIYVNIDDKSILLFEHNDEIYSQSVFESFTLSEAINHLLDEKLEYFAFTEVDSEVVTVVYKRKSGDIGIIDANMQ